MTSKKLRDTTVAYWDAPDPNRDVVSMNEVETIFVVDWDGVCCEAVWPEWGDWLPGAVDGLKKLLTLGKVRIHSSRLNPYKFGADGVDLRDERTVADDITKMRYMLDQADLFEVEIHTTHGKPTGHYYIDDRAVEFKGSWEDVLDRVCMKVPQEIHLESLTIWDETAGKIINLEDIPAPMPLLRSFEGGATRNTDTSKEDYEGFLSPVALRAFGRYMHSHRVQKDGSVRDSDNWQKGIPLEVYMKSAWRHFFDLWELHRGGHPINPDTGKPVTLEEALMGLLFNVQGYSHEHLKPQEKAA